jgi:hypothetical protein
MQTTTMNGARKPTIRNGRGGTKPFTQAELRANENGQTYLQLAKLYVGRGDRDNAVSCCLEGLCLTFGISRPLAVRDHLQDVLDAIDPAGEVANRIRSCSAARSRLLARESCEPAGAPVPGDRDRESAKQWQNTPIILVPEATPCEDAHEPVVLLKRRGTGATQGLLVFEDSNQLHQFVYELVQIHSRWAAQCAFVPDPNCGCKQINKA